MKIIYKVFILLFTFTFIQSSTFAVDMMCNFAEYNEKVPDIKVHDIRIHVMYNDEKNDISYVHFGKTKKVDSVIDYNYDYILFKIKYHYEFGKTDVTYKIDRLTNKISTYRSEVVNGNRSHVVYYKGKGMCEVIPKQQLQTNSNANKRL